MSDPSHPPPGRAVPGSRSHRHPRLATTIVLAVVVLMGASCTVATTAFRANVSASRSPTIDSSAPRRSADTSAPRRSADTSAPRRSADTQTPPVPVEVIGDSLVRQAHDAISATLSERGYLPVIASRPREPLDGAFIQTALDATGQRPAEVVVVATAANDVLTEARQTASQGTDRARADYRSLLTGTIARFPGRCLVVVNARDISPIFDPAQARLLNADIEAVAADHDNVIVVDWASASRVHTTDWFVGDLEHFGLDPGTTTDVLPGARAYADAIADGVARCRARPG